MNIYPNFLLNTIPISRRITEIMEEKGKPFTQELVARRMGLSRKTFQSILAGKRPVYGTELKTLAEVFRIPVERLTQSDLKIYWEELTRKLSQPNQWDRASELAEWFVSVAVGRTERCNAFLSAGQVALKRGQYEKAHETWSKAYVLALQLKDKYDESEPAELLVQNLLLSCTVRKDYPNAQRLIDEITPTLTEQPHTLGAYNYTLAMIARHNGELELTRDKLYESLANFQLSGNRRQIGMAEHNVAYIEYLLTKYDQSIKYFEKALLTLDPYLEDKIYAMKDFAKVFLKQNKVGQALRIISSAIEQMESVTNRSLLAKLYLLKSIADDQVEGAHLVLNMDGVENELKRIACKILMDRFRRTGDAVSFLHYYEIERGLTLNSCELFDEEGL